MTKATKPSRKSAVRWKERDWNTRDCFDESNRRVACIEKDDSYSGPHTWDAFDTRKRPHKFLGEYETETAAKLICEAALGKGSREHGKGA